MVNLGDNMVEATPDKFESLLHKYNWQQKRNGTVRHFTNLKYPSDGTYFKNHFTLQETENLKTVPQLSPYTYSDGLLQFDNSTQFKVISIKYNDLSAIMMLEYADANLASIKMLFIGSIGNFEHPDFKSFPY